jgi:hypothetical protein
MSDDVHAPELWDAFVAGFMASGEGGNAEHPYAFDEDEIRDAKRARFVDWIKSTQNEKRQP